MAGVKETGEEYHRAVEEAWTSEGIDISNSGRRSKLRRASSSSRAERSRAAYARYVSSAGDEGEACEEEPAVKETGPEYQQAVEEAYAAGLGDTSNSGYLSAGLGDTSTPEGLISQGVAWDKLGEHKPMVRAAGYNKSSWGRALKGSPLKK